VVLGLRRVVLRPRIVPRLLNRVVIVPLVGILYVLLARAESCFPILVAHGNNHLPHKSHNLIYSLRTAICQ